MGILKGVFDRMGYSHIRMLTKDCVKLVLSTLGELKDKHGNEVYLDAALDLLIEEGGYRVTGEDLKTRFVELVRFYVFRNLGREIDFLSDDMKVLNKEIENYRLKMSSSKTIVRRKRRSPPFERNT